MSATEAAPEVTTEPTTPEGTKPTTEQLGEGGIKALKAERDAREAAEKSAKELAAKVKEFEDRDKTETEKQADELAAIKRENAELKISTLRADVAEKKGVPAALLTGSTKEELETSADALLSFKGTQAPRLVVRGEGNSPTKQTNTDSEFVSALFGGTD